MRRSVTRRFMLLGLAGILAAHSAQAVEFTIVGPRAVGMGGAGVAVTDDSLATYWNPAGLAMKKSVDVRIQGGAQVVDRLGVGNTLDEVNDLARSYSAAELANGTVAANVARLQALVATLNQPHSSLSANGSAGLYFKGYWGDHAFGFNVSDVATGGMFAASPITVACTTQVAVSGCSTGATNSLNVNGQFAVRGLEARQAAFSYAYAFLDRTLAIGVTGKIIQGAAYSSRINVQGSEGGTQFADDLGRATLSTAFGVDVGAMYQPASWVRFGIVGKDLNEPSFDAPGGGEFKLNPQVRGGVAVNPYSSLTVSFDADITSNRTFVPNVKSRVLSLGAEQMLLGDILALRLGALKNVEDANSYITPTAGFGLKVFALRVDVGAGYDFRERGVLGSASLGLTF